MYRHIVITALATLCAVFALIFGISHVRFKPPPFAREAEVGKFVFEGVKVVRREAVRYNALQGPIEIPAHSRKEYPPTTLKDMASHGGETGVDQKVSFILIKDHARIAVVEGVVVREGDKIKGAIIRKIEKRGVLIKGAEGERWLPIS